MAVKVVHQPKCSVCGVVKGEENRWFLTGITNLGDFSFRLYDGTLLDEYDDAACGLACLDKLCHAHAESLVGMKTFGRPSEKIA